MKKIILSICALGALAGFSSCGDKAQTSQAFSANDKAMADSLAVAYGKVIAANAIQQLDQYISSLDEEAKGKINRADFVRGLKAVAERDTANVAYIMGVQAGISVWGASKQIPTMLNLPVNASTIVNSFEKTFSADSIGDGYVYQMEFQNLMQRAQESAQKREEERLSQAPEAIANQTAGKEYADSLVNTGEYTRSESGLVYKITNPGEGEPVKSNRIKLRYKGMHIDGTEFDATRDEAMTTYAGRFIPGFNEGLLLLAKGGKATIVIPGDLAYGVRGQAPKIGPSETLVFDIEIEDIMQ